MDYLSNSFETEKSISTIVNNNLEIVSSSLRFSGGCYDYYKNVWC